MSDFSSQLNVPINEDNNTKQPKATVCLKETQLEMVVDTGATVNIMDENT
jgi:hypothetical protein